jgi:hypothetical protein
MSKFASLSTARNHFQIRKAPTTSMPKSTKTATKRNVSIFALCFPYMMAEVA